MAFGALNKGISTLINKLNPPITSAVSNVQPVQANNSSGVQVAIINRTTVMTDAQLQAIVNALQIQVTRDFTPVWGTTATLVFVGKTAVPPTSAWQLVVTDNTTTQGLLGYHTLTTAGLPIGYAFAKTDMQYGLSSSVTISHELLEMLIDPDINLTVFDQSTNTTGIIYAYEICDPVQDDSDSYLINGISVSNFVYPSWFETFWRPNSTRFDQQGRLTKPFQLLHGGYVNLFDVTKGSGWQEIFADEIPTSRILARKEKGEYARPTRRVKNN